MGPKLHGEYSSTTCGGVSFLFSLKSCLKNFTASYFRSVEIWAHFLTAEIWILLLLSCFQIRFEGLVSDWKLHLVRFLPLMLLTVDSSCTSNRFCCFLLGFSVLGLSCSVFQHFIWDFFFVTLLGLNLFFLPLTVCFFFQLLGWDKVCVVEQLTKFHLKWSNCTLIWNSSDYLHTQLLCFQLAWARKVSQFHGFTISFQCCSCYAKRRVFLWAEKLKTFSYMDLFNELHLNGKWSRNFGSKLLEQFSFYN